jgi:endonuclease-3
LKQLSELEAIHAVFMYCDVTSPRDNWETWITNFAHLEDCDIAFMCLITIIMSSSTSDNLLASLMPRLFCSGLTSARGVIEIVQQFGVDSFCSLLAPSGRYYQNGERILNVADYFVRQHNGRISNDIPVVELCTLLGVGYKTANIVVTTAFGRIEGIPSDMHVIYWCALLGWTSNSSISGLECSKSIEQWLPKDRWGSINPLFGALGQLITGSLLSKKVMEIVRTTSNCCVL